MLKNSLYKKTQSHAVDIFSHTPTIPDGDKPIDRFVPEYEEMIHHPSDMVLTLCHTRVIWRWYTTCADVRGSGSSSLLYLTSQKIPLLSIHTSSYTYAYRT